MTKNDWCLALGIAPPKLEAVAGHREANTFALLLVALLERGAPMTLVEVAARFEAAGIAERSSALLSLSRCKPGRPPCIAKATSTTSIHTTRIWTCGRSGSGCGQDAQPAQPDAVSTADGHCRR